MAHVTFPILELGKISVNGCENEKDKKSARLRVVSALLKSPVEQLTVGLGGFPTEYMADIEACATVTQIQLFDYPPSDLPEEVPQKLQKIAARNRKLIRCVANLQDCTDDELVVLLSQFANCPTGRYMLARSFPPVFSAQN